MAIERRFSQGDRPGTKVTIHTKFTQFSLPPVRDALIVGKKTPIGPRALYRSIETMSPREYELIEVDHSFIEAIIVRSSDLRKLPAEKLVPLLIETAERVMDETDCLRVDIEIEVWRTQEVEV